VVISSLSFLTPDATIVCAAALVPLTTLAWILRGHRRAARILGLAPEGARGFVMPAVAFAGTCVALGLAAGQPVFTTTEARSARSQSEVMFVVDVSRSMLGATAAEQPTRLDHAREIVGNLRGAVPDVRAGLAGLTDRVLPFAFPTLDRGVFDETLVRSVLPEAPPPQVVSTVATTFAPLSALTGDGYFSRGVKRRTCVLVTDGETRSEADQGTDEGPSLGSAPSLDAGPTLDGGSGEAADSAAGNALAGGRGCRLIVVRVGSETDRIYTANGRVEAAYRPEQGAAAVIDRLAETAGGQAFDAGELDQARAALRADALVGPTARLGVHTRTVHLAPFLAAIAIALGAASVALQLRRLAS
jgi:von Willebrand factor type A domain